MRTMVMMGAMVLATTSLNAQNFKEWFKQNDTQLQYLAEQIAALGSYGEVIREGYRIAQEGLGSILKSRQGDYYQHENYFTSLGKVKADIKNYGKVLSIAQMREGISKQYGAIRSSLSVFLTGGEKKYIAAVFNNLVGECDDLGRELDMVIQDGLLLKDDERVQRIDRIYLDMLDRYAFSQSFLNQVKLLVISRAGEKREMGRLSGMHGLK